MTNFDIIKSLTPEQYTTAMPELNYKRGVNTPRNFIDWLYSNVDKKFWLHDCEILHLSEEYING